MEELAREVREMEQRIYEIEALGAKRGITACFHFVAGKRHRRGICKGDYVGLDKHQSASRRCGRTKKQGPQSIGSSRGGKNTKLHMVAASDREAVTFSLSPGEAGDAPRGRDLLRTLGKTSREVYLLMDKAYEGNATRNLAVQLGFIPVVPPKITRKEPWDYDRELYKRRNEIERLFRRIKRFRRIFTRYDKLDIMFLAFIFLALIVDALL